VSGIERFFVGMTIAGMIGLFASAWMMFGVLAASMQPRGRMA
jgi:hypothetical protein